MTDAVVFDATACTLGEGPLWHPERQQLFWFDIKGNRMLSRNGTGLQVWQFSEPVSAAGWIDHDHLLIASASALMQFDLGSGTHQVLCALEADNPRTRSNDGRADPQGGFWIGTMGRNLEPDAGAIYRYYRGELRQLYAPWTIPNATCFAPDGRTAYLADTQLNQIWRIALDADGWPDGEPQPFLTMDAGVYRPDGAVVDRDGCLWIAHYGHGKVTCHGPDGVERARFEIGGKQTTCPAFGGPDLQQMYVTSAADGLEQAGGPQGATFVFTPGATGQAEHRVIL